MLIALATLVEYCGSCMTDLCGSLKFIDVLRDAAKCCLMVSKCLFALN